MEIKFINFLSKTPRGRPSFIERLREAISRLLNTFVKMKNSKAFCPIEPYGRTPLFYATQNEHVEVVKYLCENCENMISGDPLPPQDTIENILHSRLRTRVWKVDYSSIFEAAIKSGNLDLIEFLCTKYSTKIGDISHDILIAGRQFGVNSAIFSKIISYLTENLPITSGTILTNNAFPNTLTMAHQSGNESTVNFLLESYYQYAHRLQKAGGYSEETFKIYQLAADNGHLKACYETASCYEAGRGIPQDLNMSLKYRLKGNLTSFKNDLLPEEKQTSQLFFEMAEHYRQKNNPKKLSKVIEFYKKAAESRHPEACYILATYYQKGVELPRDVTQAVHYYKIAADQGHAASSFNLGLIHHIGQSVPKNLEEAKRYYRMAANQGHKTAQDTLAKLLYQEAQNILATASPNYGEAYKCLLKAAQMNHEKAIQDVNAILNLPKDAGKKKKQKDVAEKGNNYKKSKLRLTMNKMNFDETILKKAEAPKAPATASRSSTPTPAAAGRLSTPTPAATASRLSPPTVTTTTSQPKKITKHTKVHLPNKPIEPSIEKKPEVKNTAPEKKPTPPAERLPQPSRTLRNRMVYHSLDIDHPPTRNSSFESALERPLDSFPEIDPFSSLNPLMPQQTPQRVKKKGKMRLPKTPKWVNRIGESKEQKNERKRLERSERRALAIQHNIPELDISTSVSSSRFNSDDTSNFFVTESEIESTATSAEGDQASEEEKINIQEQLSKLMEEKFVLAEKAVAEKYPQLYDLLSNTRASLLTKVRFKDSEGLRATLKHMKAYGLIDGRIKKDKIVVVGKKDYRYSFVSHTTHGSANHAKWYRNPGICLAYFAFIARFDEDIHYYLMSRFGEHCLSRGETISLTPEDQGTTSPEKKGTK